MDGTRVERSRARASVLGKYRLIAELGHGGMAEVFLALIHGPAGFSKLTVLKQIRPHLADDPEFLTMFLDEARLAARLNHPNVVQTNEVGHEDNRYFIAMEYLEGQPLNRALHRIGRDHFPLGMHLRILADALAGLHYAHELSDYDGTPLEVVHRDMTPHNIFVTYDGQVKVVDFGIAKAMGSSAETRAGVLKGKVAYMAPEQAEGERVDRRSDIFAVGIMLWEAAVGRRMWKALPDVAILGKLVSGEIPRPRAFKADLSPDLEEILRKALTPKREHRYRTAADLQNDLENYLERSGERISSRDIGRLLGQHFEEERLKIKTLVENQLRDARNLPTDEYQAIKLPVIEHQPSFSSVGDRPSGPSELRSAPSTPYLTTPGSLSFASTESGPNQPTRSRRILIPIAAASGAALAVMFWLLTRPSPQIEPPPAAAEKTEVASPQPATTAEALAEVELHLKVSPLEGRIFVDDEALPDNPTTKRFPKDGKYHDLRFEAPGYQTTVRKVMFDKDLQLELSLEKDRTVASRPGKPVATPPPEPTDDMKPPVKKPTRSLDTSDPFANPQ